ncbi:molybdate ABC transporter substrate-binding protein [Marinobacter sp.]|uniref:molybdate ABC transporter substrate-binding protein n=1 Tax=Marinobacter sp. TaxID=50741 RepID=UPI0039B09F2B
MKRPPIFSRNDRPSPAFLVPVLSVLILLLAGARAQAGETVVAVAANFTDTARELAQMFEARTDHQVTLSFGSTGKLYAQIANGAPFDVFLAGDAERPELAVSAGLAVAGTRFTYAEGKLVLWSLEPALVEQGRRYLAEASPERLAIANPVTAPYGLAAQQVMQRLGVWQRLEPRLVRGESIAQTFQFVATANAEAGFVALAQLRGWSGAMGSAWEVPQALYDPVVQQAVLLNRGRDNDAARAWLAFLREAEAVAVIESYGYGVPAGQ